MFIELSLKRPFKREFNQLLPIDLSKIAEALSHLEIIAKKRKLKEAVI